MDWLLYAWLKRGKRRKQILSLLHKSKKPFSINDVRSSLKLAMAQASFSMKELSNKGLIECLNPKENIGKLYRISEKGKEMINDIQ